MSIALGVTAFALLWWLSLFLVLPWGIRSQDEDESVVPGSAPSAPSSPMIWRKLAATTGVAAVLWLGLYALIEHPPAMLRDYIGRTEIPPWIQDPAAPSPKAH